MRMLLPLIVLLVACVSPLVAFYYYDLAGKRLVALKEHMKRNEFLEAKVDRLQIAVHNQRQLDSINEQLEMEGLEDIEPDRVGKGLL